MTSIPPNPEEALVTISTPASDTVRVRDRVESSRFEFYFDGDVAVEQAPEDDIYYPVDVAATIVGDWEEFSVPLLSGVNVRNAETGQLIANCSGDNADEHFPDGNYILEILSAPVKIYLAVHGGLTLRRGVNGFNITCPSGAVTLGSRSLHEQPAGTIQVTSDPADIMQAVSLFGSALKTTSPERSWPTLRGYPPQIEIAESTSIPSTISRPDVDIRIEIPETLEAVFQVAPLAFYTAADIRPMDPGQDRPCFVTGDTRIEFDPDALGESAARLLQDNFLLDTIVRTAGFYSYSPPQHSSILSKLPWPHEEVYDLPLAERIAAYSRVPERMLEAVRPTWPLTVDVSPIPKRVPLLPHLSEELATIRPIQRTSDPIQATPEYLNDFVRADGSGTVRGARTTSEDAVDVRTTQNRSWDSQIHTYIGEEYPLGSNKTRLRAYNRHLERGAPEKETIEVHVVCNDEEMSDEEIVTEFYGVRDLLELDVTGHNSLTAAELAELLQRDFDLIHYIGHIDEQGITCEDGYLDLRDEVDTVGVDAFILNACRSIEQGEALLDAGAGGGIGTLYDVPNSSATRVGRSLSRLLNRGFNLRSALEIARDTSVLGQRWISIGDGKMSLTQPESGVPFLGHIEDAESGYRVEIETFETRTHRLGTITSPSTDWGDYTVVPSTSTNEVSPAELDEFFALEVFPFRYQNELLWTDETSVDDLQ